MFLTTVTDVVGFFAFLGLAWLVMGGVAILVTVLIVLFYKELLITSFDALLAGSQGFAPGKMHLALMAALSIVIVAAFESVGAILVIAMLILPGATAQLLSTRLPVCLALSVLHAALSAIGGLHLSLILGCPMAAAAVVAGTLLFGVAWMVSLIQRRAGTIVSDAPAAARASAPGYSGSRSRSMSSTACRSVKTSRCRSS